MHMDVLIIGRSFPQYLWVLRPICGTMRKCLSCLIAMCFAAGTSAQFIPTGISYQAVVRDIGGNEVTNQNMSVRIGIMKSAPDGDLVYEELHEVVTNVFGLFSLVIGEGVVTGNALYLTLGEIPFGADVHFMRVEADTPQSVNYELLGVSQLLAVPYAYHALTAASAPEDDGDPANELIASFSLAGPVLTITEGGIVHEVDLSALDGAGNLGTDPLISSVVLNGMFLQVTENEITYQADLSPVAYATWQAADPGVIHTPGLAGIGTDNVSSTLTVGGSVAAATAVFNPTGGINPEVFQLDGSHHSIIVDIGNGAADLLLPHSASCPGRQYMMRRYSSVPGYPWPLSILAAPGDTIDGAASRSFSLSQAEYITIVATDVGWFVINYSKD